MKSLYHYRKERRYEKPLEVIWPFVADTARINELSGSPVYQVEERPDAQGRIHRFGTAGLGPLRLRWGTATASGRRTAASSRCAISRTALCAASRPRSSSIRTA